jgi:interleukin-1 receptor-associated kinase 2
LSNGILGSGREPEKQASIIIAISSFSFQDVSTSIPKQEKPLSWPGDSLFWSEADVVQATSDFDQSHRISEGTFADIYRGQRHGVPFVFKKLREVNLVGFW